MTKIYFVTGTDTGVGKTVFTGLFTEFLRREGIRAAALKPICSGGRDDARLLHAATGGALDLDDINPWFFKAPIAPSLAAQKERKIVKLAAVLKHIRAIAPQFDCLLIEGAGGLLSPLGIDFNSRDLMAALNAAPIVVAASRLGVVNQLLLTIEALPHRKSPAPVVLMDPKKDDLATRTNAQLIQSLVKNPLYRIPWLAIGNSSHQPVAPPRLRPTLRALSRNLFPAAR